MERWTSELKANGRLSKAAENTLDNAFVKIQDKSEEDFLIGLICEFLSQWKCSAVNTAA